MKTKSLEALLAERNARFTKMDDLQKKLADLDNEIATRQKEDRHTLAAAIGYAMIHRRGEPKVRQILDELLADNDFKRTKLLEELLNPPKAEPNKTA